MTGLEPIQLATEGVSQWTADTLAAATDGYIQSLGVLTVSGITTDEAFGVHRIFIEQIIDQITLEGDAATSLLLDGNVMLQQQLKGDYELNIRLDGSQILTCMLRGEHITVCTLNGRQALLVNLKGITDLAGRDTFEILGADDVILIVSDDDVLVWRND